MLQNIYILVLICFFANVRGETQRIAGGEAVTISDYPFAAALLTNRDGGAFVQTCGGTILTANAILSASSCFYSNGTLNSVASWRARVGSTNANSGGTIHILRSITVHEAFSPTTLVNDIAVLRTSFNIALQSNLVQTARIAGAGYTFTTRQVVIAIGWGIGEDLTSSEQLRRVQVWTVDNQTCANRYSGTFAVTDNMVCAGWIDVGIRGQCAGDVGSPLLDTSGAVVGVFSFTEGCALDYVPDINTRVSAYTNWIITAAIA